MQRFTFLLLCSLLMAATLTAQVTLVPFGSSWNYLDNGTNQGTAWRALGFNDGAWKTGNGKLGYGLSGLTTTVSYGPDEDDKYITTYFRKTISIADVSTFTGFTVNAYREDGVVVYVNGMEVYRNNMPTGTISYTTAASASPSNDGAAPVTFTVPVARFTSGSNVIAAEIHQKSTTSSDILFDLNLVASGGGTTDPPPSVFSINRQSTASTTSASTVVFRATFSEGVTGVDVDDFAVTAVGGSVAGSVSSVAPQSGSVYDVTVSGITGTGELRLDLKGSGTGITDANSQPLTGGFTAGQTYIIQSAPPPTTYGFASTATLAGVSVGKHTGEKPQAKVWRHDGRWWCVLPTSSDTKIFRLDGTSWTPMLSVYSSNSGRADCWVVGDVVHILLFRGASTTSYLVSVQYDSNLKTYKLWSLRTSRVALSFGSGAETATLAMDGTGRLWIASCGTSDVNVRWSAAPYSSWSSEIKLATNVADDDICTITTLPGKIGVLWSNQNTRRFYFRTHSDGASPATWSPEELPAIESVKDNVGLGLADDHLNIVPAADGTLYCAVKTGFDRDDYPTLALLVRRPAGTWDPLYPVTVNTSSTHNGTRPVVLLNEALGKIKVVYTSVENGGDILYKESPLSNISFGATKTLLSGNYNNATSTHQTYSNEVVVLATNQDNNRAEGIIGFDNAAVAPIVHATQSGAERLAHRTLPEAELLAWAPASSRTAVVSFILPSKSGYTLSLYNMAGARISVLQQGRAIAGQRITVPLETARLPQGMYLVKLQTSSGSKTVKMFLNP
ncbi:T9SS type A sorting domain-containing protein [Paraflavisolibacter sp. H34]|uniref:T9SS type A sorting domain-containing protein n=1 Tax=Huijunlia imazamoxiresistens TaxID=3127457 RepID=UPI003017DABB